MSNESRLLLFFLAVNINYIACQHILLTGGLLAPRPQFVWPQGKPAMLFDVQMTGYASLVILKTIEMPN